MTKNIDQKLSKKFVSHYLMNQDSSSSYVCNFLIDRLNTAILGKLSEREKLIFNFLRDKECFQTISSLVYSAISCGILTFPKSYKSWDSDQIESIPNEYDFKFDITLHSDSFESQSFQTSNEENKQFDTLKYKKAIQDEKSKENLLKIQGKIYKQEKEFQKQTTTTTIEELDFKYKIEKIKNKELQEQINQQKTHFEFQKKEIEELERSFENQQRIRFENETNQTKYEDKERQYKKQIKLFTQQVVENSNLHENIRNISKINQQLKDELAKSQLHINNLNSILQSSQNEQQKQFKEQTQLIEEQKQVIEIYSLMYEEEQRKRHEELIRKEQELNKRFEEQEKKLKNN